MSIYPRKIDREKDKYVTIHMRVNNNSGEPMHGIISIDVYPPDDIEIIGKIRSQIHVPQHGCINKYFRISTKKLTSLGRYRIEGSFTSGDQTVHSETSTNDFFEVVK